MRLWDGVTGVPIATLDGHPQFFDSLSRSPVTSWLGSIFSDTTFRNWDGDTGPLFTCLHSFRSSEPLFISLDRSKCHSRRYWIQATVPGSNACIPLLWLPVDISYIVHEAFCSEAAAFGFDDGQVIILDLTQLNLQESVMSG